MVSLAYMNLSFIPIMNYNNELLYSYQKGFIFATMIITKWYHHFEYIYPFSLS